MGWELKLIIIAVILIGQCLIICFMRGASIINKRFDRKMKEYVSDVSLTEDNNDEK